MKIVFIKDHVNKNKGDVCNMATNRAVALIAEKKAKLYEPKKAVEAEKPGAKKEK